MGKPTGSSGKYLEIVLDAAASTMELDGHAVRAAAPLAFEDAFRFAYPNTGRQSFVSREVMVVTGGGTIVMRDGEGDAVTVTMEELDSRALEFTGVVSASGVSRIGVFL